MKKIMGLAKNGFKLGLAYRGDFFVSLIAVPLSLLIYYSLWTSIFSYGGQQTIGGYSFTEMIYYYVLSMIVGTIIYCDIEDWMSYDVRTGNVVVDFMRPISYMSNLFSINLGLKFLSLIVIVIPTLIIGL